MTQTTEAPTKAEGPAKSVSKTGWKAAKTHPGITLPSGAVVSIVLPNMSAMVKAGDIPNALLDQALGVDAAVKAEGGKVTRETLEAADDYIRFIVPLMVVDPKITEADIDDLPVQDLEMLAAFASRVRDMDAVGHQLGGLETVKSFRRLRNIYDLDEVLESA